MKSLGKNNDIPGNTVIRISPKTQTRINGQIATLHSSMLMPVRPLATNRLIAKGGVM